MVAMLSAALKLLVLVLLSSIAPNKWVIEASLGKMPTTLVRRLFTALPSATQDDTSNCPQKGP